MEYKHVFHILLNRYLFQEFIVKPAQDDTLTHGGLSRMRFEQAVSSEMLPDWLEAIQTGKDSIIPDDVLTSLADGIWDLVDGGNLEQLNLLLGRMDVERMPSVGIEALLRYTYPVRTLLDAWTGLSDKASMD